MSTIVSDVKEARQAVVYKQVQGKKIVFNPPYFANYLPPDGVLDQNPACHALFYYNLLARNAYDRVKFGVELEGETTMHANYAQLFTSIAQLYGIRGEQMVPFWKAIDMQCFMLHIPVMPDEERYRFNGIIAV